MGTRMSELSKFATSDQEGDEGLGDAISGAFDDVEVDSVAVVREIRRRS